MEDLALLFEINGQVPDIEGTTCRAFLVQSYLHRGIMRDATNVAYLLFDQNWIRLYFEPGIIFWREQTKAPQPYAAPEINAAYFLKAIIPSDRPEAFKLKSLQQFDDNLNTIVKFIFENGKEISLIHNRLADQGRFLCAGF